MLVGGNLMIHFKKGLYKLNDDKNYNFQLNRAINWDGGALEDIKAVSDRIDSPLKWKKTLIELGDSALKEKRLENAIAYYRMSEFFMYSLDEDKLKYYKLAKDLFYDYYDEYFKDGMVERKEVPYESYTLPVLVSKTNRDKKGTIVIFGGNDSYMEELFFPMLYLKESGYDVYLFEGPGQGSVLREQDLKFTHEWEKPVKSVLDYFELDNVILIGISLGGMLAPRAAAFEKRVTKIVAWSVFPSFIDVMLYDFPRVVRFIYKGMLNFKLKFVLNFIIRRLMKKEPTVDWGVNQGMHAYGADTPYDYLKKIEKFSINDTAYLITQDILILQGKKDHFINWKLYEKEILLLKSAKSITFRLFTDKEDASDHCQVGNPKLALDTILKWLESFD